MGRALHQRHVRAVVAGTVAVAIVGCLTLPSSRGAGSHHRMIQASAAAMPTAHDSIGQPAVPASAGLAPVTPVWSEVGQAFLLGSAAGGGYAAITWLLSKLRGTQSTDDGAVLTDEEISTLLEDYAAQPAA